MLSIGKDTVLTAIPAMARLSDKLYLHSIDDFSRLKWGNNCSYQNTDLHSPDEKILGKVSSKKLNFLSYLLKTNEGW